jgi:hypothetical protein
MLRTQSALISLTLLSTLGTRSEAQVRERVFRPATTATTPTTTTARPPGMVAPEEKMMLRRFLAGPANLSVTGTPAMASLRWDTLPGAIGYNVSRTDPAGTTVRLTPSAITSTSFQDQSGGIKPGVQYRYNVTAAYPDGGAGTADVSFTPPPAAAPAWLRVEPSTAPTALVWAPVPDAGAYQIIESWTQTTQIPVYSTVYSQNGTATTVVSYQTRNDYLIQTHVVTAPQSSLPLTPGHKGHRFDVGASYPPSGVTAPRGDWRFVVVP